MQKPIGFNVTKTDGATVYVKSGDFKPDAKRIDVVYIKGERVEITAVFADYGD